MKLLKVKNGLLEVDNFYLTSFFSDFARKSNVVRDIKTGKLKIISNNFIERKFTFDEFVIEFEKENFKNMSQDDYCLMYLGNKESKFGIREINLEEQNAFWKILKRDNYIQAYASKDGINYTNLGGMKFDNKIERQGFEKFCDEDFILKNYKVYANPYITLQNAPDGSVVQFYNKDNKLILERKFGANMECKVFLDGKIQGYFVFKDLEGKEYYKSSLLDLSYGDVYILSPYNLEIIYHGNIVTNDNPGILQDLEELVSIKNIDTKEYKNLTLGTETNTNDLIELSWDGEKFDDTLTINKIVPGESKNLFVRIIKNIEDRNFSVRDFQLIIQK